MTQATLPQENPRSPTRPLIARVFADGHFTMAAILMLATAMLWPTVIAAMQWTMVKYPVAWPEGAVVSKDFRLLTLPHKFGKYSIVEDGKFDVGPDGKRIRDGQPDGEIKFPAEERLVLGVGTHDDGPRLAERKSNWYVSRIYVNTAEPENSALRHWRLDVSYYTGATDSVAHVPGRCMVAAGAVPSGGERQLDFDLGPAGGTWGSKVALTRAGFVRGNKFFGEIVQYYTFSLNGINEPSWKRVRLHMASSPWEKNVYFAKIQFGPARPVSDLTSCDQAAREFMAAFLPEVLRQLPSEETLRELNGKTKQEQRK